MERDDGSPARWAVSVRWGAQRLSTEILDRHRPQVTLGDQAGADVVTGHASQIVVALRPPGVSVRFSAGVTGAYRRPGDWPMSLDDVKARGVARAEADGWVLDVSPEDELQLNAGTLAVEVAPVRGVLERLPFDPRWLLLLLLAVLGVVVILGSVLASEPVAPNRFIQPGPRVVKPSP